MNDPGADRRSFGNGIVTHKLLNEFWGLLAEKGREAQRNPDERNARLPEWATELTAYLQTFAPDLAIEIARATGGGIEATITANGVHRHFDLARGLARTAPAMDGVTVKALRAARSVPGDVRFGGQDTPAARLRVNATPVMSKMGILLLTSGVAIDDYVLFRNLGRRLIMDLVGEERFGLFVTDVQVMDHAVWESGAHGQESLPLADVVAIVPPAPANCDEETPAAAGEPRRVA